MFNKISIFLIILIGVSKLPAQTVWIGDQATMSLSNQTIFYFEGGAKFNGTLKNNGTLSISQDIEFFDNDSVGNIRLIADGTQQIIGDSIMVRNLFLSKTGRVVLNLNSMFVMNQTDLSAGTIYSDSIGNIVILGVVNEVGDGFVEGPVLQRTTSGSTTLPLGINGFRNYLFLNQTNPGFYLVANSAAPNPDILVPNEEMVGIADEQVWVLAAVQDSIETSISAEYSGIDLDNFSITNAINSDVYEATIASLSWRDTTFQTLASDPNTYRVSPDRSSGTIESATPVTISVNPLRIGIAEIPVLVAPVLYIPNSFAPDGQYQENQTFRPFFAGASISRISIRVYDANNSEVYTFENEGSNLDLDLAGWDGSLPSGGQAQRGIYFYSLQLEAGGTLYDEAGSVLLVRL